MNRAAPRCSEAWSDKSAPEDCNWAGPPLAWASDATRENASAISFCVLGWLGAQSGSDTQKLVAQILTFFYFSFFFTMPIWTAIDKTKPVPERVTFDH